MTDQTPTLRAACLFLAVVQGIMLAALFAGVEPHPPRATPLFAMAPFLAVSIGAALTAMQLADRRAGRVLAGVAAALALISFGPQKYLDPAFAEIWIAVLACQIAVATIAACLIRPARAARAAS